MIQERIVLWTDLKSFKSTKEIVYLQHQVQTMQITCMCKHYQIDYAKKNSVPQQSTI